MTHLSTRRILDLPAIGPCDSISPSTLLRALMRLSGEIVARRSDAFPVHRRMILETIRQVGVLREFFQDVIERGTALPGSVTVSLSELYIELQKIHHLISDCARRGARLWILARSDQISSEFRLLIRSISIALDVLPLDAIDAAPETKELIRLLTTQARKVGVEVDPADDSAARTVRFVLNRFRRGLAPEPGDLIRVLDRLNVRTWSECDEEVLFLEEEMFSCSQHEDGEVAILGTLMSFMVYCRVVLFTAGDGEGRSGRNESAHRAFDTGSINPETLMCPIYLEIMKDPVTISTGHTYERAAIKKWIKSGSRTCPITGEKLANVDVVPNSSLRRVIEQFYRNNGVEISESSTKHLRNIEKTAAPFSPAAAGATKMAMAFLVEKLAKGAEEEKRKAVYEIRKLSKFNLFNRVCLVEADAVPRLLSLLSSSDAASDLLIDVVSTLLNLSKHPRGRKAIFEAGGVGLIVDTIRVGLKVEAQNNAAAILFYLSSVEEYRKEIGEIGRAVPTLLELLQEGAYRGKKNALTCLFGLLQYPGNHPKIVAAGAISVLVDLLSSDHVDLVSDSVQVLEKIAERDEGTDAIIGSSALTKIAETLSSSASRSGKEHCVSLLLHLCSNGGDKVVSVIERMPSLISSLYGLVTEGSPQGSRRARLLLNRVHRRSSVS